MMPCACCIIFSICHKHISLPLGPVQPSSPFTKKLHASRSTLSLSLSLSLLNTTQHTLSTSRFNTITSDVPTQSLHRKLSQKKVKRKDHFFLSFSLSNPPPLSEAKPKHKRVLEREVRRGMYEFVRKTRLEKPSHLHRMTDIHKSSPKS